MGVYKRPFTFETITNVFIMCIITLLYIARYIIECVIHLKSTYNHISI